MYINIIFRQRKKLKNQNHIYQIKKNNLNLFKMPPILLSMNVNMAFNKLMMVLYNSFTNVKT